MSDAARYKEIIAGIAVAAEELRDRDRERAAVLVRRLVTLDAEMLRAGDRAALTRLGTEIHWETAMEALWVESWLTLRPRPAADPDADPADLDDLDAQVLAKVMELQEAVKRRRFGFLRR